MKDFYSRCALFALVLALAGCDKVDSVADKADDTNAGDSETGAPVDTATVGTDTGVPEDTNTDSVVDTGDTETQEEIVPHTPIVFTLTNTGDVPRYVTALWTDCFEPQPFVRQTSNGDWENAALITPDCRDHCNDDPNNASCGLVLSGPTYLVYIIQPGETVPWLSWDGQSYSYEETEPFTGYSEPIPCACYREATPPEGSYRLTLDVYDSIDCYDSACPIGDMPGWNEGLLEGDPAGDKQTFVLEFDLPTTASTLNLDIQ